MPICLLLYDSFLTQVNLQQLLMSNDIEKKYIFHKSWPMQNMLWRAKTNILYNCNNQTHRDFNHIRTSTGLLLKVLSYTEHLYLRCKMLDNQASHIQDLGNYLGKEVTIPSDLRVSPTSLISVRPSTLLAQLDLGWLIYSRAPTPSSFGNWSM